MSTFSNSKRSRSDKNLRPILRGIQPEELLWLGGPVISLYSFKAGEGRIYALRIHENSARNLMEAVKRVSQHLVDGKMLGRLIVSAADSEDLVHLDHCKTTPAWYDRLSLAIQASTPKRGGSACKLT